MDEVFHRHDGLGWLASWMLTLKSLESRVKLQKMLPFVFAVCSTWGLFLHALVYLDHPQQSLPSWLSHRPGLLLGIKASLTGILFYPLIAARDSGGKKKNSWAQETLKDLDRIFLSIITFKVPFIFLLPLHWALREEGHSPVFSCPNGLMSKLCKALMQPRTESGRNSLIPSNLPWIARQALDESLLS